MIQKNLNEYQLEYQVQILRETLLLEYPFEFQDIIDYENNLDFKILSKNHQIHWSIEILEHFKDKWDWGAIQSILLSILIVMLVCFLVNTLSKNL